MGHFFTRLLPTFRLRAGGRALCALLWLSLSLSCAPKENDYIHGIDDLYGKKVGVVVGSTHDAFLSANYPEFQTFQSETLADMALALSSGQLDAVVNDNIFLRSAHEQGCDFRAVGDTLFHEDYGMGFRDPALRDRFNVFLAELRASGEYDRLVALWVGDEATCQIPEMDFPAPKGDLTIASGIYPYFVYMKDNRVQGLEVHLLSLFCLQEGYRPVVNIMNFSGVLTALAGQKADVIAGTLSITPERSRMIHFSDSFYTTHCLVVVKEDRIAPEELRRLREATPAAPRAEAVLEEVALEEVAPQKSFRSALVRSFHNNLIKEKRYKLIWEGLKQTLGIALSALLLGTLLGMGLCWLRMRPQAWASGLAKAYIVFMQGIPQVVLLMLMFYVVFASTSFSGLAVAIITFSLNFAAFVAEIFRTSILGIDRGQTEAGISLGFSPTQTFFRFVAPQALRHVMPLYKGETISLVKMTSIVGYIAVQDLTKASDIIRSRTFDAFFPLIFISIIYFVLAWLLAKCVEWIQVSLPGQRPGKQF